MSPETDPGPRELALVTDAARMLAEARSIDDIRLVRNLAQRAEDYARAARLGLDAQNSAASIRLEAEAKAGELLRGMAETGERRSRQTANPSGTHLAGSDLGPPLPPTLDDLGVTTDESHRWQAVASVPPEERQAYVAEAQQREQEVTRAGLLRFARPSVADPLGGLRPPEPARGRIARTHLMEHLQQARIDADGVAAAQDHHLSQDDREQIAAHLDYIRWRLLAGTSPLREVRHGA